MNSIVLSSPVLSGGNLIRILISEITGLEPHIPPPPQKYTDENWHFDGEFVTTEITPGGKLAERLRSENVRPIFLVRSLFDLVVDQYRYYASGSPNPQNHHLKDLPPDDGLAIIINGGDIRAHNFPGLGVWARQQQEMLRFAMENPCYVLSYEKLLGDPRGQIITLARYLDVNATMTKREEWATMCTSLLKEKTTLSLQGSSRFRYGLSGCSDGILKEMHYRMVDRILEKYAPDLGGIGAELGFHEITAKPPRVVREKLDRLFVATIFKSGTKLLELIVERLTGLSPTYLGMEVGSDYEDPTPIRFEKNEFFIWHNVPSPAVKARLRKECAKPIFLIRNIYDLAVAQYFHFAKDVDKEIGHGTKTASYFTSIGQDEGISSVLCGTRSEKFTWHGFGYYLRQTQEILKFAKEYPCHIILFDRLVMFKKTEILELAAFLDIRIEEHVVDELLETSSLEAMRKARTKHVGSGNHFRKGQPGSHINVLKEHHYHMINHLVHEYAPLLPGLCHELGFGDLIDPRGTKERYPSERGVSHLTDQAKLASR
ncbi:sulfotransferase domain-containing protein [Varunaivibrio sulfuroxidans]|uniref:Sulfotransferase domain-containing protein n=1 Tax=Varunaivibrio sulfuroxidans TaxID=1773489 RepID=A0A4R3JHB7_9PROT|nr:sulfotransferase domain-containing protein [Varunaivibrio sulfuroxidans]TCS64733.1 sulfotransferase domain-containing protein [Varunaivibrio sulfuroxidans]WES29962.1 sulfotransferase domain-containing protein [Varunaivibrio sulfuroxidans]